MINGPRLLYTIPILGGIPITETMVSVWVVMLALFVLSLVLTRKMSVRNPGKRQIVAEMIVGMIDNLVESTMGKKNLAFAPYILTLFAFSFCSSIMGLFGLRPPTADLNTTLGWALITVFLIYYNAIRAKGVKAWLKGFAEPFVPMLPLNLVSEVATPVSLSFRHFGNIIGGFVITKLIYMALANLSALVLSWTNNPVLMNIPILQVGIPAVLSIYFDIFSAFLQAFIFVMLSMSLISSNME